MMNKKAGAELGELIDLVVETHPKESFSYILKGDYLATVLDNKREGLAQFRKAAELDQNRFEVWGEILSLDAELGNMNDLIKDSESVMELFPNEPIPFYYHGVANNQLGKSEAAIKSLKKAGMMVTNNPPLASQIYALLGDAYHGQKDFGKSDESFEKALTYNPNNENALNNYAYFLSLRNDKLDKAAEMAKKANQLAPNQASYEDTYAWILYMQKKYPEAREWMEKALANGGSSSGTILEHYGDILYQLGDVAKALDYWQQAKQKGDASAQIDQKIRDKKVY